MLAGFQAFCRDSRRAFDERVLPFVLGLRHRPLLVRGGAFACCLLGLWVIASLWGWSDGAAPEGPETPQAATCPACDRLAGPLTRLRAMRGHPGKAAQGQGARSHRKTLTRAAALMIDALNSARRSCLASTACTPGPGQTQRVSLAATLDSFCSAAGGPLAGDRASLVLDRFEALAERCLAEVCPVTEASALEKIGDSLSDLEQAGRTLAAGVARAGSSQDLGTRSAGEWPEALLAEVTHLPGALVGAMDGGDQAAASLKGRLRRLRSRVDRMAVEAKSMASRMPAGGHGPWRWHLLSARLERIHAALTDLIDVPSSRPATDAQTAWARLATGTAGAFLDARRLEQVRDDRAQPAFAPACVNQMQASQERFFSRLARVRSDLRRCIRRSGGGDDALLPSVPQVDETGADGSETTAYEPTRIEALAAWDGALDTALTTLRPTSVLAAPSPSIKADLAVYQPGEAMALTLIGPRPTCLSDPGAWMGVIHAQTGHIVHRAALTGGRSLSAPPKQGDWLAPAPLAPGPYSVEIFAPPDRGGRSVASVAVSVAPFSAPEGAPACTGFTGQWQTQFGLLSLTVRDGTARGTYRKKAALRPGFLTGRVEAGRLTGRWQSELGSGSVSLELGDDGRSFTGAWGLDGDRRSSAGAWSGQCQPAAHFSAPRDPDIGSPRLRDS